MTIRVVQWTTGKVGTQSVTAIARNPGLELVGCYARSRDKGVPRLDRHCIRSE